MGFIFFIVTVLLFAVLFILLTGLFAIGKVLGGLGNLWYLLTGKGKKHSAAGKYYSYSSTAEDYSNSDTSGKTGDYRQQSTHHKNKDGKVFSEDEGTYVEFEEIKN